MDVIGTDVTLHNGHPLLHADHSEHLSQPQPDFPTQYRVAVFRLPYEVILQFRDGMRPSTIAFPIHYVRLAQAVALDEGQYAKDFSA